MTGDYHGFARHTQQHAEWPRGPSTASSSDTKSDGMSPDDDGDPPMCQHSTTETMATDACHSTTARAAASGSSPNPAIAVCFAPMVRCRARRFGTGSAPECHLGGLGRMTVGETFAAPSPPLCPSRHPPQSVAACLSIVAGRILAPMPCKQPWP